MTVARFPTKRDDGSVSVAARFTFDTPVAIDAAEAMVRNWIAQREAEPIDLSEDLAQEPFVVVRDERTLDVVFDGRPESPRWKDWMVLLSQEMTSTVSNVTFDCFFDLVGNVGHPASRIKR